MLSLTCINEMYIMIVINIHAKFFMFPRFQKI